MLCTNDIINQVNCKTRFLFLCNDYFNSSIFVSLKIAVGASSKINGYILKPVERKSKNTNLIADRPCVTARVCTRGAVSFGKKNCVRLDIVVYAHSGQRHRSPTAVNQRCPATCPFLPSRHFGVNTILTRRTNVELHFVNLSTVNYHREFIDGRVYVKKRSSPPNYRPAYRHTVFYFSKPVICLESVTEYLLPTDSTIVHTTRTRATQDSPR